jgi:RHS repeat-associated protein
VFKNIRNSKRYDGMNRLSKEYTTTNNKEKVKAQYTYGKTGGVTLVTNDTSAIANKYDNKGLVMEQKLFEDGKSYAMVYGNNANGKCVYSKIYNNNTGHYGDYDIQQMINYEYDAKGNMTTVSDSLNNSKVMARYTYDSNDNLSSVTYGNGTSTSYTYNKGNMIEKVINNNADNTQMSIYSYDYYLDGNVSQQNRNGVKCYYDYDEFSRIIDEDYDREEIDYFYDAAGNRTLKKICDDNGDTDVNYTYDLNNRLLEESTNYYSKNEIDVTKYVYDNNGNQIKKIGYTTKGVNGSPSQDLVSENELNNTYEMYKYNEFNEMTSFESNKEAVWYYAYLPNGLRYRKNKNNYNNSDWYIWDRNGNIIAEMNNDKEYTNKYIRGNKLISKNGNEYYSYDGHGSVVNISNEDGKSIKNYDYDAFGVELNKDANDTNLFRYCGEQYDNETDSIYLRARYYSPSLGRFTTEDPAKDGDNWYSYCAGNPVNSWDPSGLALIISDIEDENDSRLSDLRKLTSDNLKVNYDTGEISYIEGEKIDLPTGTDLVRDLINSDINITIRKFDRVADKEYTRNGITNYSYDRQGNCVSMIIFYDPNGGTSKISYDPVTVTSSNVSCPSEILLGHELVHAVRVIRGEHVLPLQNGYYSMIYSRDTIIHTFAEREELETTGISYAKFDENDKFDRIVYSQNEFKYTENALRVEAGLPVRSVYNHK